MADGVKYTEPDDGTTLASDDCGADGQVQLSKLAISTDGSATLIPATASDGLLVNLGANNDVTVSGVATAANQATEIAGLASIDAHVDGVEASLASIDGKTPALGQALAAASVPVVLTAAQLSTLTPLSTIAATQSGAWNITNVSGTISLPTGAATSAKQDTELASLASIDGKITACNTGAVTISAALPAGTNAIGKLAANSGVTIGAVEIAAAQTIAVTNAGTFATQAAQSGTWNVTNISGTVSLPTGAATAANQTSPQTPITPATATATVALLVGMQYNSTQATFTNGQQGTIQGTARGAIYVATGADTFNVTVNAALPAGSNAIGKLAANSGVDIGDVDITSIAAGDNNIGNVDIVTVPTDPFGANADAASATGSISAKLRFIAATGIPITSVPSHAVTNAGTFATQSAITAASASIASGAFASGSIASGAFASGSIASGAIASGAIASGAVASGAYASGAISDGADVTFGAKTDAKSTATDSTSVTAMQVLKQISASVQAPPSQAVTNAGTFQVQIDAGAVTSLALMDDTVFADDAAFTVGTSKVTAIGVQAVAHGSNPDAADALDAVIPIANRHRIPYTIGGHPNVITYGMSITTAATNAIIGPTIASGTKLVVTGITVVLDNGSTVFPSVVIGFGATTTPAFATTPGTLAVLAGHPAVPAGGGFSRGDGSGIIGIGADGEELRITTVGTAGGNGLYVLMTGYTIES